MTFREKAKNLFKTKSRSNSSAHTNGTTNGRQGSNVYKAGEMPQPKYRRPPNKEHKEHLEAFDFGNAWRKTSFQSNYSPGGTRMQSRRASWMSLGGRKSMDRKSMGRKSEDGRNGSVTSIGSDEVGIKRMPTTLTEYEGDDDVGNVGISRYHSKEKPKAPEETQANGKPSAPEVARANGQPNGLHKTETTAQDHEPFSERDFEKALHKSQVPVSVQS